MPQIDLTSIWIPGGLIGILVLIMIRLFINERRSASVLAAETASSAPVEVTMQSTEAPAAVEPPPMADKPAEAVTAPIAEKRDAEKKPKAKRSFVWRTAWIWLPFLAGFLGQAYLDIFKPIVEPLLEKGAG